MGLHEPRYYKVNATSETGRRGGDEQYNAEPASIYLRITSFLVLRNKERKLMVRRKDEKGEEEKSLFFHG